MNNLKIFVFFHNDTAIPQLYLNNPEIYFTIHLGSGIKNSSINFTDNIGDNISYLNPYINEVTGVYWVYKHYELEVGNPEYVGFMHYRRYFEFDNNLLNNNTILCVKERYRFNFEKFNHLHDLIKSEVLYLLFKEVFNSDELKLKAFIDYISEPSVIYGREMFITSKDCFFKMFNELYLPFINLVKKFYELNKLTTKFNLFKLNRAYGYYFEILLSQYLRYLEKYKILNIKSYNYRMIK